MGKRGTRVSQTNALDYVFGHVVSHDLGGMDVFSKAHWGLGSEVLPGAYYITLVKCPDTFQPIGPFLKYPLEGVSL